MQEAWGRAHVLLVRRRAAFQPLLFLSILLADRRQALFAAQSLLLRSGQIVNLFDPIQMVGLGPPEVSATRGRVQRGRFRRRRQCFLRRRLEQKPMQRIHLLAAAAVPPSQQEVQTKLQLTHHGIFAAQRTPGDLAARSTAIQRRGERLALVLRNGTTAPEDVRLTSRKLQDLQHIALGLSNQEISQSVSISVETVKQFVKQILRKLPVTDRTQAAIWAVRRGLV